ncbi:MAG: hypothetical protein ACOX6D_08695 [Thermoguttaceae bacterium]|jgi:pimeloyl-ACP methyl ester carboxylesterase
MNKRYLSSVFLLFVFLFLSVSALYADGAYYAKNYPAPDAPVPGTLAFDALWQIWIPPHVETLRGVVVHQHGCGLPSCEAARTAVCDLHWQSLARKHDSALIAVSYNQTGACELWCDPRNGSADSFLTALDDFAEITGHPELSTIPWALWGHSGGAQWCSSMTHLYPERVVAAWLRSGHTDTVGHTSESFPESPEFFEVPILFNIGTREREGNLERIWKEGFPLLAKYRAKGAKIGFLVDPHTGHETGDSRYPAIRFLDEILAARLPLTPGESLLRSAPEGVILSADETTDPSIKPYLENGHWLPSEEFSEVWRRYGLDASFEDGTPPSPPFDLRLTEDGLLTWDLIADPESGFAAAAISWNGATWNIPEENRNPYGKNLYQGLRYSDTPLDPVPPLAFHIPGYRAGVGPVTISVSNTCGLSSPSVVLDQPDR